MVTRQFTLFLLASGTSVVANIIARVLFSTVATYEVAVSLAYLIGMIVAFSLNRALVFRTTHGALHKQAFWFITVNMASLAQTLVVSLFLLHQVFPRAGITLHTETIAHVIGLGSTAITSYLGHKYLTFKAA